MASTKTYADEQPLDQMHAFKHSLWLFVPPKAASSDYHIMPWYLVIGSGSVRRHHDPSEMADNVYERGVARESIGAIWTDRGQ